MAADELDVPFERIEMVMGDTATHAGPVVDRRQSHDLSGRLGAPAGGASARRALVARAAERLGVPAADLIVEDGVVRVRANRERALRYSELIGDGVKLEVDPKIELKKAPDYKVIGKSIPRVDIPTKVTGEFTYIHDFRLPGMLHARVIRPDDYGARIVSVDDSAARQVGGFVQTVRKGDFLAVVARNEWAAIKAARAMKVTWTAGTGLPEQATVFETWRKRPIAKEDITQNVGDAKTAVEVAPAASRRPMTSRCRRTRQSGRPVRWLTSRRQADGVDVVAGDPLDAARTGRRSPASPRMRSGSSSSKGLAATAATVPRMRLRMRR